MKQRMRVALEAEAKNPVRRHKHTQDNPSFYHEPSGLRPDNNRRDPDSLSPEQLLHLQQTIGNRAASQLVQRTLSKKVRKSLELSPLTLDAGTLQAIRTLMNTFPEKVQKELLNLRSFSFGIGKFKENAETRLRVQRVRVQLLIMAVNQGIDAASRLQKQLREAGVSSDKPKDVGALKGLLAGLPTAADPAAIERLTKAQSITDTKSEKQAKEKEIEEETEESASGEGSSGADSFDFPAWNNVAAVKAISSGNGGVLIVTFASGAQLVVKKGGPQEVAGSLLAQKMGLPAPRTRMVNDQGEATELELGLNKVKHSMNELPGSGSILVVDFVEGVTLGDVGGSKNKADLSPKALLALAPKFGQWYAYHILIQDQDNFAYFGSSEMHSINSSNFFIGTGAAKGQVIGVDQNISSANKEKIMKLLEVFKTKQEYLLYGMASPIASLLGVNPDAFMDGFAAGVEQGLGMIKANITPEDILRLQKGLGLSENATESLLQTLDMIQRHS